MANRQTGARVGFYIDESVDGTLHDWTNRDALANCYANIWEGNPSANVPIVVGEYPAEHNQIVTPNGFRPLMSVADMPFCPGLVSGYSSIANVISSNSFQNGGLTVQGDGQTADTDGGDVGCQGDPTPSSSNPLNSSGSAFVKGASTSNAQTLWQDAWNKVNGNTSTEVQEPNGGYLMDLVLQW